MNIQNWFIGMVEDIADPNGMGRVRVRCFNYHVPLTTDSDEDGYPDLDTPDLLWAPCILPVDNPSINGVAGTPGGLMPGSMVMGFFRDGDDMQDPVVIGGISEAQGYETQYDTNMGFGDPNGVFTYNSFKGDFPEDSGTFSSANGFGDRLSQFAGNWSGNITGGPSIHSSGFEPQDIEPIELTGDINTLISSAMSDVGTIENKGENRSSSGNITKYWEYLGRGVGGRLPYCAAFVSYHLSKILPPEHAPKNASSTGFLEWARRKPFCKIIWNPKQIEAGDIIKFTGRHVALCRAPSSGGMVPTVEGNCACPRNGPAPGAEGVWAKEKRINSVHYIIRIIPEQAPTVELPPEIEISPSNPTIKPQTAPQPSWNPEPSRGVIAT